MLGAICLTLGGVLPAWGEHPLLTGQDSHSLPRVPHPPSQYSKMFFYFLFFLFHFLSCISSPQSLFPKMITSHPAIRPISTKQSPRVSIRNWSPSDSSSRKLNTLQVQYKSCVSGSLQIVRILNWAVWDRWIVSSIARRIVSSWQIASCKPASRMVGSK